ncbi:hypothetical protein U1Q18_006566, partial [Sarracenia purpurea var. burkii]
ARGFYSPSKGNHEIAEHESSESSTKQRRRQSGGDVPVETATNTPEREPSRNMEMFNNMESGKNSNSNREGIDQHERFSEEIKTRTDKESGKLTKSNRHSKDDPYQKGGNVDLGKGIDVYCRKNGNVIFGPNGRPNPVGEALNGIMGSSNPLPSSPRDKNRRPDPVDHEIPMSLENNCVIGEELFLSRARNWKRRARFQEKKLKSKGKQSIFTAEAGEKKRKSCNNGDSAEEQPNGKRCCSEGEKQRLEMDIQGTHLIIETAVADFQHRRSP